MSFIEGGPKPPRHKSLIDRLPGSEKRREQERKKNELIQAFMIKAIQDLETSGFSIRRKEAEAESSTGYRGAITSRLVYAKGHKRYSVSLRADVSRPAKPIEYTSETHLTLGVEDERGVGAPRRTGYIVKEKIHSAYGRPRNTPTHIAGIKLDLPNEKGEREYHGFHSHVGLSTEEKRLNTEQTIGFLEELLQARVDPEATQQLLATIQDDVVTKPWMVAVYNIGEVYWNRERPGAIPAFLAAEQ